MEVHGPSTFGYPHAVTAIVVCTFIYLAVSSGGSLPHALKSNFNGVSQQPWRPAGASPYPSPAESFGSNHHRAEFHSSGYVDSSAQRDAYYADQSRGIARTSPTREARISRFRRDRAVRPAVAQSSIHSDTGYPHPGHPEVSGGDADQYTDLEEIYPSEGRRQDEDDLLFLEGDKADSGVPAPSKQRSKSKSAAKDNQRSRESLPEPDDEDLGASEPSPDEKRFPPDLSLQDMLPQENLEEFVNRICTTPITTASVTLHWSLDDAIRAALAYSHGIQGLKIGTLSNYQDIGIAFGNFDTTSFLDQNFRDSNRPVGTRVESDGTVERIKGEELNLEFGIRQQLLSGGQVELSRSIGTRDDNSGILIPRNQATSGLNLRLTKELLRGAGRSIGMNEVLVATQRAEVGKYDNIAEITSLLSQVSTTYWAIFAGRGALLAAIENANLARSNYGELQARQELDADPNLLEQARVAFEQQKGRADRLYADLAKAQFELVRLVNAPELLANQERIEIIPTPIIYDEYIDPDLVSRQTTGIHNRPEVRSVVEEIREAQYNFNFSMKELLPRLTFSAEAGFAGLSGDRDIAAAATNQFDANATYDLGFSFEMPLQNRAARFSKRKAELILAQLGRKWSSAVELVKSDVLVAAQDIEMNQSLMKRQSSIFESAEERLRFLNERRYRIPKKGAIPSLQLGQLLNVQSQVADSKADFVSALADRQRARVELNRASGIFVRPGDEGLDNPGAHGFLTVFTQSIKTDRCYRQSAKQVARNIAAIARRPMTTWCASCLHSESDCKNCDFDYPLQGADGLAHAGWVEPATSVENFEQPVVEEQRFEHSIFEDHGFPAPQQPTPDQQHFEEYLPPTEEYFPPTKESPSPSRRIHMTSNGADRNVQRPLVQNQDRGSIHPRGERSLGSPSRPVTQRQPFNQNYEVAQQRAPQRPQQSAPQRAPRVVPPAQRAILSSYPLPHKNRKTAASQAESSWDQPFQLGGRPTDRPIPKSPPVASHAYANGQVSYQQSAQFANPRSQHRAAQADHTAERNSSLGPRDTTSNLGW